MPTSRRERFVATLGKVARAFRIVLGVLIVVGGLGLFYFVFTTAYPYFSEASANHGMLGALCGFVLCAAATTYVGVRLIVMKPGDSLEGPEKYLGASLVLAISGLMVIVDGIRMDALAGGLIGGGASIFAAFWFYGLWKAARSWHREDTRTR